MIQPERLIVPARECGAQIWSPGSWIFFFFFLADGRRGAKALCGKDAQPCQFHLGSRRCSPSFIPFQHIFPGVVVLTSRLGVKSPSLTIHPVPPHLTQAVGRTSEQSLGLPGGAQRKKDHVFCPSAALTLPPTLRQNNPRKCAHSLTSARSFYW